MPDAALPPSLQAVLFDEPVSLRAAASDVAALPFDIEHDERRQVDGRPCLDGIECLLAMRGIVLPRGGDTGAGPS